ncbi:MAG: sigma-70 family RNA polymerase sigma factor [Firmicutes bacterium]|nr:sigma-70 family RNA polymerase sigma factor [Bacillota bacterium]
MADLESIYRQHADAVFRFLMSKTGSVELAEELTQETFYQAVKSIDRYDGTSRVTSWLCGIAQNVLYAHLRARQKDPLPLEDVPEQPVVSTEDVVVTRDETRAILEAIRELPDPGGEIMRLRISGGLSFKQIGAILGRTETWARVNYYRAKQSVIKELNRDDE